MGIHHGWYDIAAAKGLLAEPIEPPPPLDCSEKEFDAAIMRVAKKHNWLSYHTHNSRRSAAGWPDRVFCKPPKLLIVELKIEGEKVKAAQLVWLTALRACGIDARTWWPSQWAEILETLSKQD